MDNQDPYDDIVGNENDIAEHEIIGVFKIHRNVKPGDRLVSNQDMVEWANERLEEMQRLKDMKRWVEICKRKSDVGE